MIDNGHELVPLLPGRYEQLVTESISAALEKSQPTLQAQLQDLSKVPADLVSYSLQRFLASRIKDKFQKAQENIPDDASSEQRNEILLDLTDRVMKSLELEGDQDLIQEPLQKLRSVAPSSTIKNHHFPEPILELDREDLIMNTSREHSLNLMLKSEIASADSIDLLCSFIKFSGIRVLEEELRSAYERGTKVRVLTTVYMGATEKRALDDLARIYGAEVKVNYDVNTTRLHAKAWLFRRKSGFHTAYVGSSNLSSAALVDGLEWNVRLAKGPSEELLQKFQFAFDTYWESPKFESYDPETDADHLELKLRQAGSKYSSLIGTPDINELAAIEPYSFQRKILEALETSRVLRRLDRNLVVAATGTGKTVVAALDYQRLCLEVGRPLRLLFVAHRNEILKQSRETFARVLADANFGEMFVDGQRPESWQHVFASIQSLMRILPTTPGSVHDDTLLMHTDGLAELGPEYFDVVIVDEFHHAEANSYQKLLNFLRPRQLLGLTATPERADGRNVAESYFDGRYTYELRLWDAIDEGLLVPFQYFGISDNTDLSQIRFRRGSYDQSELQNIFTANDVRTALILRELQAKITDVRYMKALGFCVGIEHAKYMAQKFNEAGIPSVALSGENTSFERHESIRALKAGEINCIFSVDIFNEGVDIPSVDTVLLLRPTQSATVFLQQIGRGLRRHENKDLLTVLDFIGQQHEEFRFEHKLTALLETSVRNVKSQLESERFLLPSGCHFELDRVAQKQIIAKLQSSLGKNEIVKDIQRLNLLSLRDFLNQSGYLREEIYQQQSWSWTQLLRDADVLGPLKLRNRTPRLEGLSDAELARQEKLLLGRVRQFQQINDELRVEVYTLLLSEKAPSYETLTGEQQRVARMLFYKVFDDGGQNFNKNANSTGVFSSFEEGLNSLRCFREVCQEFSEIMALEVSQTQWSAKPLESRETSQLPFHTHSYYSRAEVLAALDYGTMAEKPQRVNHREGVLFVEDILTDIFFVTLEKNQKTRSETTMYRDFAVSREIFHWQSQSGTSQESNTGQRYISSLHQKGSVKRLLFVRRHESDQYGTKGAPFVCLGYLDYIQHAGSKPITFTWRLSREMPEELFQQATPTALAYAVS